jgi:hypothetical protein
MMRKVSLVVVMALFALGSAAPYAAARGVGTSAADFFKEPLSTRATGMGGAYVAVADDLSSMEWNPAGLSLLTPNILNTSFEHVFSFADVEYEELTMGQSLGDNYGGGAQLLYRHMPDIDNDLEDESPVKVYDIAGMLGYGFQLSNFSVGLNLKFFQTTLGDNVLFGEAVDLGFLVFFMDRKISLGVAIQNLGPDVNYDSLPLNVRGGFAYKDVFGENKEHGVVLGLELNQPLDNKLNLEVGGEYWYRSMFGARVGYKQQMGGDDLQSDNPAERISFGASVRWSDLQLDYSFVPYADLGNTHRLTLTARYGPLKDEIENK